MFPNLRAEMARKRIILEDLAKEVNCTVGTVSNKLTGKQPLLFSEARIIQKRVAPEIPLEILFEEEAV